MDSKHLEYTKEEFMESFYRVMDFDKMFDEVAEGNMTLDQQVEVILKDIAKSQKKKRKLAKQKSTKL